LESGAPASEESLLGYHPFSIGVLTLSRESGLRTVSGGQFDWGGRLPKGNGGAQRFPQRGWESRVECKGIRELDCKRDISSRYESRA
jgi:hypothetical protein